MDRNEPYIHYSRLGLIILVLTISACTSSIPQIIKTAPANNPDLQQVVDQARRSIVAARGLTFVTTRDGQGELRRIEVQPGMKFEKRFIDATEFFGAEVLVVNSP